MRIQIIDRAKKKKFIVEVEDLGMKKIPQLLVRSGKERIRAYSGDLSKDQIMDFWKIFPIEGVGLYVGKDMMNRNGVHEVRLSLDGMHTWKEQLTERVIELTAEQEDAWFTGKNIESDSGFGFDAGFVSVKGGEDFVGMGKVSGDGKLLLNFLPKERRRKSQVIG